jgi:hypothetical protein
MADSLRQRARDAARVVAPEGVERLLTSHRDKKLLRRVEPSAIARAVPAETRVREAVRFLVSRGLTETSVTVASMPEDSLEYMAEVVTERLPSERPVRALHVGNFVGVSLCYLTCLVQDRHTDSVVVSVDPNITHRWIGDSQAHVVALLHHFNLLSNSLIIPGYSLERTPEIRTEALNGDYPLGCENVLTSLARVCGQQFDLVLLDGNHEEDHLAREFDALRPLLADGSVVVFDDVGTEGWPGVGKVFGRVLGDDGFVELGHDGRVGILQVRLTHAE